jgi:general secretion pathway protein D
MPAWSRQQVLQQRSATSGGNGVTILADAASNSLVINAPDHLYNSLRAVIDKLDAQRAQVFVEALIVEVTSAKAAELGIQWQAPLLQNTGDFALVGGTNFGSGGNNLLGLSASIAAGTPTLPGKGLNLALGQMVKLNGKEISSLTALARLLEADSDANILSTPNLLTMDNEEAKIVIGQNVPFITGSYAQAASTGTGASVNPFQTIERKDVGLTLKVKPQVSEGGTIKLQIMQEVSNVSETTNSAGIITNKRSIETSVLVGDGEAIVLGGLIQDDVQNGVDKVPGLGDLPLIGGLFRSETRKRTKTNLMVFLRPVVVRSPEALSRLTESRYDYIRNVYGANPAPQRKLLPDNTVGKLPDLKLDSVLTAQPMVAAKPDGGGSRKRKPQSRPDRPTISRSGPSERKNVASAARSRHRAPHSLPCCTHTRRCRGTPGGRRHRTLGARGCRRCGAVRSAPGAGTALAAGAAGRRRLRCAAGAGLCARGCACGADHG